MFPSPSQNLVLICLQLRLPSKLGRLPSLIGEPAGGSLTADQWLVFATVVAPLAVSSFPFFYFPPLAKIPYVDSAAVAGLPGRWRP